MKAYTSIHFWPSKNGTTVGTSAGDNERRSAGEPDDAPEISQANRRQTGLGIAIRWRVGVSLQVSGSRPNTTTESER